MRVLYEVMTKSSLNSRSTGLYLMELRRRVAETHSRRHKLEVPSGILPSSPLLPMPIRGRQLSSD
jgi:hypothetical protein